MVTADWCEQIGQQSKKIFFQYNLLTNRLDMLTAAVTHIWETDTDQIRQHPETLLGLLADEEKEAFERYTKTLLTGTPVVATVRMTLGRRSRFLCFDTYPIRDKQGAVVAVAGIVEDITPQRQYQDYLTEFAQRKDSMLEMVLHDLRGPLSVVKSVAGLLRRQVDDSRQEEVNKFTSIIEHACTNCTDLINDLLSEEHLRSPEVYVNKTRVNLADEVRKVTESYQKGLLVSQKIELDMPQEPLVMELDQIKLSQILNNLISNSLKFTPAQGYIRISARRIDEDVLLEHRDNGIGIPEHFHAALFDRQSRAGRPGLQGEKSRGLGLSIVRQLVELQGGRIWVESQEHEGTTFFIRFPAHGQAAKL